MLVRGLQGGPRRKGNTAYLLSLFLKEAEAAGARTRTLEVDRLRILPCKEYVVCEKKGFCPIDDDMKSEGYALLRRAEVIVAASPVFFYGPTAQLKALIDRSQTLWARKYRLKLSDPRAKTRKGFFLSVGATKGKHLFEGIQLTFQYFFDAVDADFQGGLTYRQIEKPGDLERHPAAAREVKEAVERIVSPLMRRKKVLFLCRDNAVWSPMAAALAQSRAGDRIEALSGGLTPAEALHPEALGAMAERGIDLGFQAPRSAADAVSESPPELIVQMEAGLEAAGLGDAPRLNWDLPAGAGLPDGEVRRFTETIDQRVIDWIDTLQT